MKDHGHGGHGHDENGHDHGGGVLGIDLWKYRMEIGVLIVVIMAMAYLIPPAAERDQSLVSGQQYVLPAPERQPAPGPQPAPTLTPRGLGTESTLPESGRAAAGSADGETAAEGGQGAAPMAPLAPESAPSPIRPGGTTAMVREPMLTDLQMRGAGCLVMGGIGAGLIYIFGPAQLVALITGAGAGAAPAAAAPAAGLSPAASAGVVGSVFTAGCALGALVTPMIASAAGETNQIATEVAYTFGQLPGALIRSAQAARSGLVQVAHSLLSPFSGGGQEEPAVIVLSQQPIYAQSMAQAVAP